MKNNLATAVLDGLELLDGDKLKPHQSRYAKVVLEKLEGKPPGQVVNRKELIAVKNDVERESRYQLEPEFLLIVLLSLVQNGNITLSVSGKKLDAANLSEATKTPLDQLVAFKHIEKPKGLPLAELVALFELLGLAEGLIRNENTHDDLYDSEDDISAQGPVECLGMKFPNDEARRAHFIEQLRQKLKDPAFRKIEGFPIGDDEDILALSDPPYYTACPNPFLEDFSKHFSSGGEEDNSDYYREPFTADVSEGRTGSIYTAHSYHTKVPHKAIICPIGSHHVQFSMATEISPTKVSLGVWGRLRTE